jgi:phosphoribosylanthranilate isomerase
VRPTQRPRVKVCCIANLDEAWTAIEEGASALGLVSDMPSGPGVIAEADIARIAAAVPPGVSTFLLTSLQEVEAIVAQQRRTHVGTLQICDRLLKGSHRDLRVAMPGVRLVQVVHVIDQESLDEALAVETEVDALLLDSGRPDHSMKELGGTGRTHDWAVSLQIRETVRVPVFLAGGLSAENVIDAIRTVGPFGLDVCSGVRTDGVLDAGKLGRFVASVAGA